MDEKLKKLVSWKIYIAVYDALAEDAARRGFPSVPALVNHLLTIHYFGKNKLR